MFVTSLLLLVMGFNFVNFGENDKLVKYWVQPKIVDYGKYPYRLSVIESESKLQFFKIGEKEKKYKIVISRNNTKPELHYMTGHNKSYSFSESNKYNANWKDIKIRKYIERCKIVWSNKGIPIVEPSGHELFFPLAVFVKAN